ncbi:NFACT RNA binding domain-containing protein [Halosquirtibacter laminarini]|uniref:NFACT RNA binding domain-containing protein n=1 Tax=Halosquirtibacter laminarini TaxID=3374600 RepID=A0AC61NLW0_9BACT|nr:NFACT RNA binding domain-containing protein [Prolixibacteraceae bacterium]
MRKEEIDIAKVAKVEEIDGFTILVGRNAAMNDILTVKIANPNDIWMHASGVPGSHVVIRVESEIPNKEVIKKAAKLAAKNSKGKGKVNVVYTEAKNVKKSKGLNVGQVIITSSRSKTVKVFADD